MNYLRGDQLVKNREGMVFNQLQYTHNNTYMHAYIYEEIVKLFSKTPVKSRFIERRKNKKEREREKKWKYLRSVNIIADDLPLD